MKTTKSKKKSTQMVTGAVLLAIMLTASACGSNNVNTPNNANQETVAPSDETSVPDATATPDSSNNNGVTEPGTAQPDATPDTGSDNSGNSAVKTGTGTYTGQIDSHSIEIETDNGPQVFQITDEFTDTLNNLESDADVKFEYTEKILESAGEKVTQFWLTQIDQIR